MATRPRKTKRAQATTKRALPKISKLKLPSKRLTPVSKMHLETYRTLEQQLCDAWEDLCASYKRQDSKAFRRDSHHLMVLLGECKYMQHEFEKCLSQEKRKSR